MDKYDRDLDALDYQIAFFTTFGLNGAEVANQLGKNKSTINRRLHNNLLIAEINFRRNQLFDTYAAKYATFTHLALDRGIENLRNGDSISFKEISDIAKGFNQMYFKDVPYRDEDPGYLAIKNYCRDFGVDANELATLAMKFIEEEYKDKKKSA
tara:strand:- start:128 stop:589 length:462 start_codon:yes stop_codon:yes gene_type:complete